MTLIKRRYAVLATMMAGVLGIGLLTALPANAAQASHTTHSTVTAVPNTATTSTPYVTLATASAVRAALPGRNIPNVYPPVLTCSVRASGLYLIQPGATWGPYVAAYAVDAIGDTAWAYCNAPVPEFDIYAEVAWSGVKYPSNNPTYTYNAAVSGTNYGIMECAAGGWQSGGIANITLPPGYVASYFHLEYLTTSSPIVATTCIPEGEG